MSSSDNFYKKYTKCINFYNYLTKHKFHRFWINEPNGDMFEYKEFIHQIKECNKMMHSIIEIKKDWNFGGCEPFTTLPEYIDITIKFKKDNLN